MICMEGHLKGGKDAGDPLARRRKMKWRPLDQAAFGGLRRAREPIILSFSINYAVDSLALGTCGQESRPAGAA